MLSDEQLAVTYHPDTFIFSPAHMAGLRAVEAAVRADERKVEPSSSPDGNGARPEVTDNRKLIDRAREMRMDAEVGTHVERMRILGELANALQASDTALSAALGGGE